ncbi:hypothetical protein HMPREF0208_03005 [Citrobacter koseri]|nr:hypothetical protein HMPREF3207_04680 [Citrobacter koseri]KXB42781.1 hypothetical protein HMPREF0208_03005 [Citrobacter koseri]
MFANKFWPGPLKKITVPIPSTNFRRVKDIWLSSNPVAAIAHAFHDITLNNQGF